MTVVGTASRSGFVTSLAWSFIILGALTTAMGLVQVIAVSVVFPADELRILLRDVQGEQPLPDFVDFLLDKLVLLFGFGLAMSLVTLVAAVALLRRRNWARLLFIGMMWLGAVSNLAGAFVPYLVVGALSQMPATAAPAIPGELQRMADLMTGMAAITGVVFAVLFAWVALRLASAPVKREFHAR